MRFVRGAGMAAIAAALLVAGCKHTQPAGGSGGAPGEGEAPPVRHAQLKLSVDKVQDAFMGPAAPAAPGPCEASPNDYAAGLSGAGRIVLGANWIVDDCPSGMDGDSRMRYEGMVQQLKQDAADLQAACDKQQASVARRALVHVTNDCVHCHVQFDPGLKVALAPASPPPPQ